MNKLKPLVFSIKDLAYIDETRVTKNFQNPHDHAVYKATEVDAHIADLEENHKMEVEQLLIEIQKLKSENKEIHEFQSELVKDCKWLPCCITPTINFFETIVQCTNGKKRVAKFRGFDFKWYDVNNGNKLNVVKWLWQPDMPKDAGKLNDKEA